MTFLVLVLFLLAGLLVGGAWSAYQQDSKFWTISTSLLAVVAAAAGIAIMIGAMQ